MIIQISFPDQTTWHVNVQDMIDIIFPYYKVYNIDTKTMNYSVYDKRKKFEDIIFCSDDAKKIMDLIRENLSWEDIVCYKIKPMNKDPREDWWNEGKFSVDGSIG